jgi:hypothetical protein
MARHARPDTSRLLIRWQTILGMPVGRRVRSDTVAAAVEQVGPVLCIPVLDGCRTWRLPVARNRSRTRMPGRGDGSSATVREGLSMAH